MLLDSFNYLNFNFNSYLYNYNDDLFELFGEGKQQKTYMSRKLFSVFVNYRSHKVFS